MNRPHPKSSFKSNLPEDEADLIHRIQHFGPQLIDGKEWHLDEDGNIHYRTIPTWNGRQLELPLPLTHPRDSLFASHKPRSCP